MKLFSFLSEQKSPYFKKNVKQCIVDNMIGFQMFFS